MSPSHKWEIANEKRLGSVLSLEMFDITADGIHDVLIGRDDGIVQVYGFDEMEEPVQRYSQVVVNILFKKKLCMNVFIPIYSTY